MFGSMHVPLRNRGGCSEPAAEEGSLVRRRDTGRSIRDTAGDRTSLSGSGLCPQPTLLMGSNSLTWGYQPYSRRAGNTGPMKRLVLSDSLTLYQDIGHALIRSGSWVLGKEQHGEGLAGVRLPAH